MNKQVALIVGACVGIAIVSTIANKSRKTLPPAKNIINEFIWRSDLHLDNINTNRWHVMRATGKRWSLI